MERGRRARLSRRVLRAARMRLVGEPPDVPAYVAVAAPHTSNWDFPAMVAMAWASEVTPVWLGKREIFDGVLGPLMRRLGGVPVDRDNPADIVARLSERVRQSGRVVLVVPPEGTRAGGRYWRSGFHRIARQARVPIVLTFLDGPSRTGGWGPCYVPAADPVEDMPFIRAFYSDKRGLRPANRTEPRLRVEDRVPPRTSG
jgi:1-acyl-sn-glycerol-3-phosphate acyltransferase